MRACVNLGDKVYRHKQNQERLLPAAPDMQGPIGNNARRHFVHTQLCRLCIIGKYNFREQYNKCVQYTCTALNVQACLFAINYDQNAKRMFIKTVKK